MTQIGAGRLAGSLVGDLKASVGKVMDEARAKISNATAELVKEVTDGSTAVEKALHREAMDVRNSFGEIIGNAGAAAEKAVAKAEHAIEAANPSLNGNAVAHDHT